MVVFLLGLRVAIEPDTALEGNVTGDGQIGAVVPGRVSRDPIPLSEFRERTTGHPGDI